MVEAVYLDTSLRLILERNAQRPPERRLPEEKLRMYYEQLDPPLKTRERLDAVHVVKPESFDAVLNTLTQQTQKAA